MKNKYKVGDLVVYKDENLVGTITKVMPKLIATDDEVHEGPWYIVYWDDQNGSTTQHEGSLSNCMVIG